MFTSILTCDQAPGVPHFWQKKLIEDYLEASGVPFVALRPGAFVGAWDFWSRGLRKGRLMALGSPTARWTYVQVDDVARYLAQAVDDPRAVGRRIDIGTDRPVSAQDLAADFTKILGRDRARAGASRLPDENTATPAIADTVQAALMQPAFAVDRWACKAIDRSASRRHRLTCRAIADRGPRDTVSSSSVDGDRDRMFGGSRAVMASRNAT